MGKKYASLHIRLTQDAADIDTAIERCIGAVDAAFRPDMEKATAQLGLTLCRQQLPFLNQLVQAGMSARAKPLVIRHHGFVSLCDKRATFENIQSIAQRLSATVNLPVLFASVYDDDVFIFGLCENGQTVSLHVSGDCEAYGMTRESHHIEKLERYLSSHGMNVPQLENLSGSEFESALIEALGFQTDISAL